MAIAMASTLAYYGMATVMAVESPQCTKIEPIILHNGRESTINRVPRCPAPIPFKS
jgi:hypothetical protein